MPGLIGYTARAHTQYQEDEEPVVLQLFRC